MKDYSTVKFKGTFRHYQQNVLDNASAFLEDGKIHIVAAPGSGKTTLGLELIRVLNEPALILSPSVTIRSQWGSRFKDGFLNDDEDYNEYVSYSLKEPKLITSVTYQGLHSAYHKLIDEDIDETGLITQKLKIDYTGFNLIKQLKKHKIKTICLDEAHHLRNEWHKSLKQCLELIDNDVTIIALTATPPYDSAPFEWQRYEDLCGEIDDEIFVPELIKKNNLCPHQDYIYFNFPTDDEQRKLSDYAITVKQTLNSILTSVQFKTITNQFLADYLNQKYLLFDYIEEYTTLVMLAKKSNLKVPFRLTMIVRGRKLLDHFKVEFIERLFEFMIENPLIFSDTFSDFLKDTLYKNGLIERKKVNLNRSTKLKKQIISSVGKLNSIGDIALFESNQLKDKLQMLILTDYIKKDMIETIGSDTDVRIMGAVPIFEKVRQKVSSNTRIALLSGSLVILPNSIKENLKTTCEKESVKYTIKQLPNVPHSIINFKGSNKQRVHILTLLFEAGYIDILIGTKSLLGEGWDSPSINTLILASFVGSYMLSNQMRGRAIRIDKDTPGKVASIWHLATVERNAIVGSVKDKLDVVNYMQERKMINSSDFDMLERRFKSFLGPSYKGQYISSGIERIDYIKGPYTEESFKTFNETAFRFASNRELVKEKWTHSLNAQDTSEILDEAEIDVDAVPFGIIIYDSMIASASTGTAAYFLSRIIPLVEDQIFLVAIIMLILVIYGRIVYHLIPRIVLNLGPSKRIKSLSKAILYTLKDMGEIKSKHIIIEVKKNKKSRLVYTSLSGATRHEKSIFTSAIKELLSTITDARYLIIKENGIRTISIPIYNESYNVPKIISTKKEFVTLLQENLKTRNGNYKVVYTRNELGRKILRKARRHSKVTKIQSMVLSRRILKEQ